MRTGITLLGAWPKTRFFIWAVFNKPTWNSRLVHSTEEGRHDDKQADSLGAQMESKSAQKSDTVH